MKIFSENLRKFSMKILENFSMNFLYWRCEKFFFIKGKFFNFLVRKFLMKILENCIINFLQRQGGKFFLLKEIFVKKILM